MTDQIKALVAVEQGVTRSILMEAVPAEGDIEVVGIVDGLDEAWRTLQETATDLVIVACTGYSDRALTLISGAVRDVPSRPVVVLAEGSPNGFFRRCFDVGADDIVRLPESSEHVHFTLEKALARKRGSTTSLGASLAPLICVLGPKGGTGKTLTAANIGVILAESGKRVALVDIDLQFGDAGLTLALTPEHTIFDLAKSGGSLDGEKVDAYLTEHESGLRVLLAPSRPDYASAVTAEFLRELYAVIRPGYDFVVVDTPPGFTPEVIATVDASSDVILVGMLDALSLKNTKLGLETLELMGYAPDRVRIVLNRADSRVGISGDDVETVLGRSPDILVPSDREIPRALNEGLPIVRAKGSSEAARAFRALAELYLARQSPDGAPAANGARALRLLRLVRRAV